jgi:hypothetical protein
MFGLPLDETFGFLRHRELEQLCFGWHTEILRFDGYVEVSVEGNLGIAQAGMDEVVYEDLRETAPILIRQLGLTITDVWTTPPYSLTFRFENDVTVRVIDSNQHYESFQISNGDHLIVV